MSSSSQLQSLSARLDALSDSLKTTLQLVHRLAKLSFHPGSTPLDSEEGDVRAELSSDIHENLKQQEEDLELLKQEVADLTGPERSSQQRRESERDREKSRLSVQVVRLGEDLRQCVSLYSFSMLGFIGLIDYYRTRSQFRKAQLTSKRNAELAKQRERELLFNSLQRQSTSTEGDQNGQSTPTSAGGLRRGRTDRHSEDVLVDASSDVTAALRRTHQLMITELQRSRFAQETLERGTAQLKQLEEQYLSLDSLLVNSRNLVSTLITSSKSDTWYLETAFYLLLATIAWLFFRRILYGPLWLFVLWPVKLGFRFLVFLLSAAGLTGTSSKVTISSSSLAQSIQSGLSTGPSIAVAMASNQAQVDQDLVEGKKQEVGNAGENLTEQIGKMVEDSKKANEPVKRGDGTVLPERGDLPKNPKKRAFDTAEEVEKEAAHKRDEL